MSRQSSNEMKDGLVFNGFDYELQVWVGNGIIQDCGHPADMRTEAKWNRRPCCNSGQYAGHSLTNVLAERGMLKAQRI